MSKAKYVFRCGLQGHDQDVRALSADLLGADTASETFYSSSRDCTSKQWCAATSQSDVTEVVVFRGHNNFVVSICFAPPTEAHPRGLVFTGSNDRRILAFDPAEAKALYELEGHTNTVSALSANHEYLLSGSWDHTARVWKDKTTVFTLCGHEAAIWSVAFLPDGSTDCLTASADRSIRFWKAGQLVKVITGHTDAVRGLAVLSASEFITCSNDQTIRHWSITGDCLAVFEGHDSFVYAVTALPDCDSRRIRFASCGEDRTMRVWEDGECIQTVTHPAQSVWCVAALPSGDIVTGASDGMVRVFTRSSTRRAPDNEIAAYESSLAASSVPAQIAGIDVNQIPSSNSLINPGKRDGQQKMVRRPDGGIELHQWSNGDSRWSKIGDVTGGTADESGSKKTYQGKEYDFVFDVTLSEGAPPLKLPYNSGDDPWMAAHTFLQRNDLSPMFLDQVANFIQSQVKGVTIGSTPAACADPFTGSGAYVAGSAAPPTSTGGSTQSSFVDPFTGGSAYYSGGGGAKTTSKEPDPVASSAAGSSSKSVNPSDFFPCRDICLFTPTNVSALMKRLLEVTSPAGGRSIAAPEDVAALSELADGSDVDDDALDLLYGILFQLHPDDLLPVLDLLRLALKLPCAANKFFADTPIPSHLQQAALTNGAAHNGQEGAETTFASRTLDALLMLTLALDSANNAHLGSASVTNSTSPAHATVTPKTRSTNCLLSLRALANSFGTERGTVVLGRSTERILKVLESISKLEMNRNIQIAASTVLLNFAVSLTTTQSKMPLTALKESCAHAALQLVPALTDSESMFRLCLTLGTLMHNDAALKKQVCGAVGTGALLAKMTSSPPPSSGTIKDKVSDCAHALQSLVTAAAVAD